MPSNTILVVDDERKIVDLVRLYLEREGYRVLAAYDGKAALALARQERPALIVLDWMLPGLSGVDVCRTLRQESTAPIVMLTARAEEADKLIGLELGADDYVTKPFSPRELVARVRAVLRRSESAAGSDADVDREAAVVTVGEVTADLPRHQVRVAGRAVELTPTEFALLATLIRSPGRVYSRLQLLDQALGDRYEGYERTVDAHIKNLRQKLEPDPAKPRYVLTVYGVGYKFMDSSPA
jgi:DNA-binding response OmpR family regulator